MKLTLNKSTITQVLFTLAVVIPFFNNYELSFIFWLFLSAITLKKSYSLPFLKYISLFICILLVAFVVGVFFDYPKYFVIRDITYMLKPVLGLLLGYNLFSDRIKNPFHFMLNTGLVMAVIHMVLVFYGIIFQGASNVREIREYGGYFNDYEVYALIFLVFHSKFEISLTRKQFQFGLLLLGVSAFFYLARTNFIQFVILFLAMKGWLKLTIRSLTLLISSIVLIISGYTAIYYYNPIRNGKGLDEFLYKIKNAPIEAFSTRINRNDWKDFNDNYRSYENVRTIEQMSHNKTLFSGEGVGSQVDLKQKVYLGDMKLRHISILHNGYMTVYLKSGLLGIILLLISIFYFFNYRYKSSNPIIKSIEQLNRGTGLFLLFSYWVFMGFYNPVDTKLLIIGFLFAYLNKLVLHEKNSHHPSIS